jgi:hypothetical protein
MLIDRFQEMPIAQQRELFERLGPRPSA